MAQFKVRDAYPTGLRVSNELRKAGVFVSPSNVYSIWLRPTQPTSKIDRLKALEAKIAERGLILTEAQVAALEKKQQDDEVNGEIEIAHPGYLGSQDIFYAGTFKRIVPVFQQTFVDTYSKVAFTKLYTTKTSITAAVLRRRTIAHAANPHRSRQRVLWSGGIPRLPVVSGDQRH